MPHGPSPINFKDPDIALMRELLNRRPQGRDPLDAVGNPNLPSVPRPPGFRQDPLVGGGPEVGQLVNQFLRIAPELRGRVRSIGTAPTPGLISRMSEAELPIQMVDDTNLLGTFHTINKDIWLKPTSHRQVFDDMPPLASTLGHELGHAAGHEHGEKIDMLGLLAGRLGR